MYSLPLIDNTENKYYSSKQYFTKSDEKYTILRYNKELLCQDLVNTYGLLRSVILSGSNVVSFAPPKSLSGENFMLKYPTKIDHIYAEEFIEGTMINVFFDTNYGANGCWQIATRNTVGAEVSFYKYSTKTFKQMFLEACINSNFSIQTLNPNFCYSFILQHPDNRIVVPINLAQIYLVGVYEIKKNDLNNTFNVISEDLSIVKNYGLWHFTGVKFPEQYEFTSYTELIDRFASRNTPYNVMGVVVKHKLTGERTKFRNPIYEEVRHLRGNQPKLQYQYLCLRHSGKLSDFLKYYPETKAEMSKFRDLVHIFTDNLHKNYVSCYVKKEQELRLFPAQYRTHMFKLHEHFINDLRPNKLCITNTEVIKYVNNLHPSLLMYCLNYNMRKRMIDTIQQPV
jgi:hypothetical protein